MIMELIRRIQKYNFEDLLINNKDNFIKKYNIDNYEKYERFTEEWFESNLNNKLLKEKYEIEDNISIKEIANSFGNEKMIIFYKNIYNFRGRENKFNRCEKDINSIFSPIPLVEKDRYCKICLSNNLLIVPEMKFKLYDFKCSKCNTIYDCQETLDKSEALLEYSKRLKKTVGLSVTMQKKELINYIVESKKESKIQDLLSNKYYFLNNNITEWSKILKKIHSTKKLEEKALFGLCVFAENKNKIKKIDRIILKEGIYKVKTENILYIFNKSNNHIIIPYILESLINNKLINIIKNENNYYITIPAIIVDNTNKFINCIW